MEKTLIAWRRRGRAVARSLGVLLGLTLAGCAASRSNPPVMPPGPLASAISARLALAELVAWSKYRDGRPVHDPVREAAVLDAAAIRGAELGLDPTRAREIIAAQIAASSAQQRVLLRQWERGGRLPSFGPLDLAGDVRLRVNAATDRLLSAAARQPERSARFRAVTERTLRAEGFAGRAARLAVEPF